MANEKRLIDTETVIRKLRKANCAECNVVRKVQCSACWVDDVVSLLDDAPTVDAVEVVRCKDCKYCMMCYPEKQIDKEATPGWYCKDQKKYRRPDDFCSYGERR